MILTSKKDCILDSAEKLIQGRGYNGFSYADIAEIVGIRKASIHHYFPSKTALTMAVIKRYRAMFNENLANIFNTHKTWKKRIIQYSKLYESVLSANKLCLCGMLAADIESLPLFLKKEIRGFFVDNAAWLVIVLAGLKLKSSVRLNPIAWQVISTLQGAVLVARMLDKPDLFSSSSRELINHLQNTK